MPLPDPEYKLSSTSLEKVTESAPWSRKSLTYISNDSELAPGLSNVNSIMQSRLLPYPIGYPELVISPDVPISLVSVHSSPLAGKKEHAERSQVLES